MILCALALAMTGCSKKEEPAAEEPAAEVEAATAAEALQKGVENAATDVKEGGSKAVEDLKEGVSDAASALVEGAAEQRGDTRGLFPSRGWAFCVAARRPATVAIFG